MRQMMMVLLLCVMWPLQGAAKKKDGRSMVRIETSCGVIRVALSDDTPLHRDNFLKLASEGFYDGLLFHRVIRDFMIQTGDPHSREAVKGEQLGDGNAGYVIAPEFRTPYLYNCRGAVAMARESDETNPDRMSDGSHFYIVWGRTYTDKELQKIKARIHEATQGEAVFDIEMEAHYRKVGGAPHLDGQYTVFGEVVEGLDVVERIQGCATDAHDRPLEDVVIVKMTVEQRSKKAGSSRQRKARYSLYSQQ